MEDQDVTGLELDELLAQLSTFVDGRRLDDDVQILLKWKGGAKGTLCASQVAVGNENGLKLRVHGTKGGLEWAQADPDAEPEAVPERPAAWHPGEREPVADAGYDLEVGA